MYLVKSYHNDISTVSGPFETHEEASRFAIGLAKTGQAHGAEIIDQDAISMARMLYRHVEKMRNDCIIEKCGHLGDAMECLSAGVILALERHCEENTPVPYSVSEDVERRR